jgi:ketosteroid isomerase-like protein
MQDGQHTRLVQDAYAAFGRGDIPALLEYLSDDIVWKGVYGAGPHVPMHGTRHGKAMVADFFAQVAQHTKFSVFEPRDFVASGDKVVVIGHYVSTTSKQKSFAADFAMVFTVRDHKIIEFQEFTDSAGLDQAYR